jgi:deoxyhypusine synthase
MKKSRFLHGKKIDPKPIQKGLSIQELVDEYFLAYNSGRLREACQLFTEKVLEQNVVIGMSLSGALSPAGVGKSCVVSMIQNGFVDWMISTGANLYHDLHFSLGFDLHMGSPFLDDIQLRKDLVIRIYDILFDYDVLLSTDAFIYKLLALEEFQKEMGTAHFHHLLGKYALEREKALKVRSPSILSAAYQAGVPIYTSSPGDSSIGMNVAAMALIGSQMKLDSSLDVNETAAIVYDAKVTGGKSAAVIWGGGSPKNFLLQTEPQIQEVLGLDEKGHDYFIQFTDARPDTGGLSGATPGEAVTWGKVDPQSLPDTVVCYLDSTVAFPILTGYALSKHHKRPLKRLYHRLPELIENLRKAYLKRKKEKRIPIPTVAVTGSH